MSRSRPSSAATTSAASVLPVPGRAGEQEPQSPAAATSGGQPPVVQQILGTCPFHGLPQLQLAIRGQHQVIPGRLGMNQHRAYRDGASGPSIDRMGELAA